MSDTPETDAQSPFRYAIKTPDGVTTYFVPAEFARKLERERDEALAQITKLLRCHHDEPCTAVVLKLDQENQQLRKERDEARAECQEQARLLGMSAEREARIMTERDEAREAFAVATSQAIEAREMLRRIMDWSPCLPEYEPDAQHLKWQSDAHAARKFLEAAK